MSAYTAGWGTISSGGSASNSLLNVKLNIYGNNVCSSYDSTDWNKQICAGDLSGQKDTCQGNLEISLRYIIFL